MLLSALFLEAVVDLVLSKNWDFAHDDMKLGYHTNYKLSFFSNYCCGVSSPDLISFWIAR